MNGFRNESQRKVAYGLAKVPLNGMIWIATCLILVFWVFTWIPPKTVDQIGVRGIAMENIQNVRTVKARNLVNVAPDPWPPFEEEGTLASEAYQNVPTLGHLTQANFDRIMTEITGWVSPDEGCNYCHVVHDDGSVDYVSDEIYTKVVSRRMLQMTQHINATWQDHVAPAGVTCYTCHRGQPVPAEIWFENPEPYEDARRGAGNQFGQNDASPVVAWAALPNDPFTPYLTKMSEGIGDIRVIPTTALPTEWKLEPDLKAAEVTYGLMMHISEALGVGCTFCHNSRSFIEWDIPQRVTGWFGIRMAQDLNQNFLMPLQSEYPATRLGSLGDAPKANCATCHQAVNKPLNGTVLIDSYPELAAPGADIDLRAASYKFISAPAPAAEDAAAVTEEAPAAEDAAAVTEEAPAAEDAAAVTEEAPAAEEGAVVTEEAPAAEDAAAVTEEAPAAEDAAAVTEEAPAAEDAAAVTEEAPAAEDAAAVTEEAPAAEDAAAVTEEAPAAEEGAAVTEEAPAAEEGAVVTEEAPAAEDAAAVTEEAPAAEDAAAVTEEAPAAEDAAAVTEEAPAAEDAAAVTEEAPAAEDAAAVTEEAPAAEEGAVVTEEAPAAEEGAAVTEEAPAAEEGAVVTEEAPAAEDAAAVTEEAPAAEDAAAVTEEAPAAEDAAAVTEEAPAAEDAAVTEEAPAAEDAAAAEEAPAAEEAAPAEEAAAEEPVIEETKVEEPTAAGAEATETASAQ